MFLGLTVVTFFLFVGHIFIGSVWGTSLVGDVGELLILLCASIFFVVAILQAEKAEKSKKQNS